MSFQRIIQGMTLGSSCTQRPLGVWVRQRWEQPPLALIDSTRLTRRACSKGSQEKNKYVQSPLLNLSHAPVLLTTNLAIWYKGDPKWARPRRLILSSTDRHLDLVIRHKRQRQTFTDSFGKNKKTSNNRVHWDKIMTHLITTNSLNRLLY